VYREHQANWPILQGQLAVYAARLMRQMGQSAACNSRHPVGARFAKSLMLTYDRAGDCFPITQAVDVEMLGTQRPSVGLALRSLARAGLVSYHQGVLTVLDPRGLAATACECYGQLRYLTGRAPNGKQ
jgi:CRP-like cAMP-binding protein